MHYFDISFYDNETGDNFTLTKEVEGDHICDDLNVLVGILRQMNYTDDTIRDYIGATYFAPSALDFDLDAATDEAINEYIASRDASDNRLDDRADYPELQSE